MQTLAGIGAVTSQTILAFLPELGQIPSPTAVALAGLAPYDRDTGKARGKRRILGGRRQVRTCLYMAAVAAIRSHAHFRDFAERLTRKGKPFKVAVTAVMRKLIVILSAMLRKKEPGNTLTPLDLKHGRSQAIQPLPLVQGALRFNISPGLIYNLVVPAKRSASQDRARLKTGGGVF